jgi:hypothetical protein
MLVKPLLLSLVGKRVISFARTICESPINLLDTVKDMGNFFMLNFIFTIKWTIYLHNRSSCLVRFVL